jgi:excisionase family DNA binding protein
MSSNIQVQKICQHCGKEFIARTTTTLYCSHKCNSAAYKAKIRAEKIEMSNKETHLKKAKPIEDLKLKEFLTITETCTILSVSRWTIWRAIKNNELKGGRIGRRVLIKRSDLDKLFKQSIKSQPEDIPEKQKQELNEWIQSGGYDITECYNLSEIQNKYGISEKALYELIKRNNIPKIKKGWYTYVPKNIIDKLLIRPMSLND